MIGPGLRRVIVFVVLAYAMAWIVALPLYLRPSLQHGPLLVVFASIMMFTPAAALLITHRLVPGGTMPRLHPGHPRRWWRPALIGWLGIPPAVVAALGLATLIGFFHPDLHGFSGYRTSVPEATLPAGVLVALTVASAPIGAILPNTLFAAGEEFGWRGFLQPELTRLSPRLGVVLTGAIWGLWHAPLLLIGYNFPGLPAPLRLLFMVVACILLSGVLGVLRQASGTVWVAALTHGTLNAWAGLGAVLTDAAHPFRNELAGMLGVCGWVALAAFYLILRWRLPPARLPAEGGAVARLSSEGGGTARSTGEGGAVARSPGEGG